MLSQIFLEKIESMRFKEYHQKILSLLNSYNLYKFSSYEIKSIFIKLFDIFEKYINESWDSSHGMILINALINCETFKKLKIIEKQIILSINLDNYPINDNNPYEVYDKPKYIFKYRSIIEILFKNNFFNIENCEDLIIKITNFDNKLITKLNKEYYYSDFKQIKIFVDSGHWWWNNKYKSNFKNKNFKIYPFFEDAQESFKYYLENIKNKNDFLDICFYFINTYSLCIINKDIFELLKKHNEFIISFVKHDDIIATESNDNRYKLSVRRSALEFLFTYKIFSHKEDEFLKLIKIYDDFLLSYLKKKDTKKNKYFNHNLITMNHWWWDNHNNKWFKRSFK